MKTSTSQFSTILDCMERNGDLNKPGEGTYGRLEQIKKWIELSNTLNMDNTGVVKPVEKWKKVWSDLKNNTKRKAAKIHKASVGASGGTPTKLALSDLELRVLNIIGNQVATDPIEVEEVVLLSPKSEPIPVSTTPFDTEPNIPTHMKTSPRSHDAIENPPQSPSNAEVGCSPISSPRVGRDSTDMPARPRRVYLRGSTSRLRAPRISRVNSATRHFQASDERWRNLLSELANEHLRLRVRELEQQDQWQVLFSRCLDVIENVFQNK